MPYSIHEPTPTYPPSLGFGRGGAGNRTRPLPPSTIPKASSSSSSSSNNPSSTSSTTHTAHPSPFSTGRGGAGNMHTSSSERRIFSFDEELAKQGKVGVAPIYHIGRGGQGNAVSERRGSDASAGTSGSDAKRGSLDWVRGLARSAKP